jgi:hypothetical protein
MLLFDSLWQSVPLAVTCECAAVGVCPLDLTLGPDPLRGRQATDVLEAGSFSRNGIMKAVVKLIRTVTPFSDTTSSSPAATKSLSNDADGGATGLSRIACNGVSWGNTEGRVEAVRNREA